MKSYLEWIAERVGHEWGEMFGEGSELFILQNVGVDQVGGSCRQNDRGNLTDCARNEARPKAWKNLNNFNKF